MSRAGGVRRRIAAAVLGAAASTWVPFAGPAIAQEVVIGAGPAGGTYFQAGRALCRLVNKYAPGLTCTARRTAGSLYNLGNVRTGALELGLARSDWQFHAVNASGPFAFVDERYDNLRALFSLHGKGFTVVARDDSGIRDLDDLRGQRVNIGSPGSRPRAVMDLVMAAKGWTKSDFALAEELPAAQQSLALCHGRIEAMVYTVNHPSEAVAKAAAICNARLVAVAGPEIETLVARTPYYAHLTIPGGLYAGNADDVPTFGTRATVVSAAKVNAAVAYAVVAAVFEHLDELRRMHPAFARLEAGAMAREALAAPLHEGARRYFRENKLR